jgi:hypothetical protein
VRDGIVRPLAPRRSARHRRRAKTMAFRWLEDLAQDLNKSARMLRTNRGFSATTIVTLALGIGASTVIFSVVDAVLLAPLPYNEADQIYRIRTLDAQGKPVGAVGVTLIGPVAESGKTAAEASLPAQSLATRGSYLLRTSATPLLIILLDIGRHPSSSTYICGSPRARIRHSEGNRQAGRSAPPLVGSYLGSGTHARTLCEMRRERQLAVRSRVEPPLLLPMRRRGEPPYRSVAGSTLSARSLAAARPPDDLEPT